MTIPPTNGETAKSRLILGNCLEELPKLEAKSIDTCITDPPYELGFMGKSWDSGGVAFDPNTWRAVHRVLKPGAFLLCFGGTRTFHRITCAIEDAGFEIRDCMMWLYGSGFPKSLDISKAIDKARPEDIEPTRRVCRFIRAAMDAKELKSRELVRHFGDCNPRLIDHWAARDTDSQPNLPTWEQWLKLREVLELDDEMDAEVWRLNGRKGKPGDTWANAEVIGEHESEPGGFGEHRFSVRDNTIREPSETAKTWDGWGSALKPAWEPIIVAMKPCDGTFAENALRHGVAGLNIDGGRIPSGERPVMVRTANLTDATAMSGKSTGSTSSGEMTSLGRFPANLLLDEEAAAALDEQTGVLKSGAWNGKRNTPKTNNTFGDYESGDEQPRAGDSGGASRFFYTAKASTKERWVHLRCNCETVNLSAWQRPAPSPNGQTDTTSLRRDTSEGDSATSSGSSMTQSGNSTTVRSPKATKSTTGTKTSKTTTSQTSNSSHRPSTSACTAGVNSGLASGGNRASSAINASPSTPSTGISPEKAGRCTGVVVDATSASSLKGSVCGVCGAEVRVEAHPTQKPLKLMEYLCTLTKTPVGGSVLDPFMGSGSTGLAAIKTGRSFVGIEMTPEYMEIAQARIETTPSVETTAPNASPETEQQTENQQLGLFAA